jgi:hypothetical protein
MTKEIKADTALDSTTENMEEKKSREQSGKTTGSPRAGSPERNLGNGNIEDIWKKDDLQGSPVMNFERRRHGFAIPLDPVDGRIK